MSLVSFFRSLENDNVHGTVMGSERALEFSLNSPITSKPSTNSIIKLATLNTFSMLKNSRTIKARKELKDLTSRGVVLCLQDTRLDDDKFKKVSNIFKTNLNYNPRVLSTRSTHAGGVTIIFPLGSVKRFQQIYSPNRNILIVSYRDQNDKNITIMNIYCPPKATVKQYKTAVLS